MSARNSDDSRVFEMYRVMNEADSRIASLGLDRNLVWNTVVDDFPGLRAFCAEYAKDHGFDLDE